MGKQNNRRYSYGFFVAVMIIYMTICICVNRIYAQENLSQAIPTENIILDSGHYGNIGHLSIPAIGVELRLNWAEGSNLKRAQRYVDMENSAAIEYFGDTLLISDHNYQGFIVIDDLRPGDKVYLQDGCTTKTYTYAEKAHCERTNKIVYPLEDNEWKPYLLRHKQLVDNEGVAVLLTPQKYDYPLALQTCESDTMAIVVFLNECD